MKKIIVVLIFVFFTGSYVSCDNNSDDSVEILRKRTENAKMIEYVDSTYGARLLYPDFFKIDSVGKSYASFSYSDENIKDLRLSFSIYPPRLIEKSKEYVRRNTDSLTTFSKVKSGSFVMTEEYEYSPTNKMRF